MPDESKQTPADRRGPPRKIQRDPEPRSPSNNHGWSPDQDVYGGGVSDLDLDHPKYESPPKKPR